MKRQCPDGELLNFHHEQCLANGYLVAEQGYAAGHLLLLVVTHLWEGKTEALRGEMTIFKLTANRQQSRPWGSGPPSLGFLL